MTLKTLMKICENFDDLGGAVQEQLLDVVRGSDVEAQNPNALKLIDRFLRNTKQLIEMDGIENDLSELSDDIDDVRGEIDAYREGAK